MLKAKLSSAFYSCVGTRYSSKKYHIPNLNKKASHMKQVAKKYF